MAQRRSSTTQLAELNAALLAQNEQLKGTARVAQETIAVQNNVQGELYRQRGVIENNIDKVAPSQDRPKTSRPRSAKPIRKPPK
jgi:hypothetical protein